MKVVVNSTPLISLSITGHFSLLNTLFDRVFIPVSVYEEVVLQGKERPGAEVLAQVDWSVVQAPAQTASLSPELLKLDRGEQDVILLAQEIQADWVLIDEKMGRRIATELGFDVKGTLGVLLIAYQIGLISRDTVREALQELSQSSVYISQKLLDWFMKQLD
ncbi:MAG: DUF3368 domain-containing protein [Hormoscilla sp.]